jgi:hypothetical protein
MPVFNVDGVAFIEKHWEEENKFLDDRKNMNPTYDACAKGDGPGGDPAAKELNYGVDLNRNFAVDFGQVDDILQYT